MLIFRKIRDKVKREQVGSLLVRSPASYDIPGEINKDKNKERKKHDKRNAK